MILTSLGLVLGPLLLLVERAQERHGRVQAIVADDIQSTFASVPVSSARQPATKGPVVSGAFLALNALIGNSFYLGCALKYPKLEDPWITSQGNRLRRDRIVHQYNNRMTSVASGVSN